MLYTLEYIWLDCNNNFRSKIKVMDIINDFVTIDDIPKWNFDGSSTGQSYGLNSEVELNPVYICHNPLLSGNNNYLVLCSIPNSTREKVKYIFDKYYNEEPWYGIEQEYFITDKNNIPINFELHMEPQGNYYCGNGAKYVFGRDIVLTHLNYCILAGLKISGINAEVAPAQWEYQIGPAIGINACDQLLVSRYLLIRTAEKYGYNISFHPKLLGVDSDWNGSGCHTNFSTNSIRKNGITEIVKAVEKLSLKHQEHMKYYGQWNELRMSGKHETSSYFNFTYGIGDRSCSVRIPTNHSSIIPYFEDRRPASNMDPYLVCSLILNTVCE